MWHVRSSVDRITQLCGFTVVHVAVSQLTRHCGLDLRLQESGQAPVHQTSDTTSYLQRPGLNERTCAASVMMDAPAEGDVPPPPAKYESLQSTTGEPNWLSIGSQPDISPSTSAHTPATAWYDEFTHNQAMWILRGLTSDRASGPDSTQEAMVQTIQYQVYTLPRVMCSGVAPLHGGGPADSRPQPHQRAKPCSRLAH